MMHQRGWWNMPCWNGLHRSQQKRLISVGALPFGWQPIGSKCHEPAQVAIETEWDAAPGPRFYCLSCAAKYLAELPPRADSSVGTTSPQVESDRATMGVAQQPKGE